ncbi:MAG: hypothetical protein ACPGOV_05340 [Magnetovibrionaceae bacterium]
MTPDLTPGKLSGESSLAPLPLSDCSMEGPQALSDGDRCMLKALRAKIAKPFELPETANPVMARAERGLSGLVQSLFAHARRDLRLRRDPNIGPSVDERALLTLVAAAQAHEEERASAVATWLFKPAGQDMVLHWADHLASSAKELGWSLSLPDSHHP